jgi:YesN/AraC family two-component response regulator
MVDYTLVKELTQHLTVLYVEDDEVLQFVGKDLFSKFFKHIDVMSDGAKGLEQYKKYKNENNNCYDIIITDINMPNMDGFEMSKEILIINEFQEIIITSSHSEEHYLDESSRMGIKNYLLKPIDFDALITVLYKISKKIKTSSLENYSELMKAN